MPEFLMEVGCEELPAGWLGGLSDQLGQRFQEASAREHLAPSSLRVLATPRRLVLRTDVLERQADREERIWGPSLRVAKDAAGQWTSAAQGFARKHGATPGDLQQQAKDPSAAQDVHLFVLKQTPGRGATEVLPGVMAATLRGLAFPKRMNWDAWLDDGKGSFPFGRPIRWLLALLDGRVVPFAIYAQQAGGQGPAIVRSGDTSYGHRFLPRQAAGQPFAVRSFVELETKLRERYVLLDPAAREARIEAALRAQGGEKPVKDHYGLTAEWRDLAEHPSVVVGRIPAEFHSLPAEVLETVLVHQQKYLPLREQGKLARFAALTDTDGSAADNIVRNMERVVVARLRDAAFFFAEDLKRPFEDRVADLAGVSFHQKLGTFHDKTQRLLRLVDAMGAEMGILTRPEHEAAREAARLAKADLTTLLVRELPELQGVMGAIYLRAQGHARGDVVAAVKWHHHPLSIEEASPPARALSGGEATVFAAVSLADKLDTLAGYFGIGLAPTGSSDPFGLRRAAQGAIRVLLDFWVADRSETRPDLERLIPAAIAGYGSLLGRPLQQVSRDLAGFLLDRLEHVLEARGFPQDEVAAVLFKEDPGTSALFDPGLKPIQALSNIHDCFERLRALHAVRSEAREDFSHLAVAFKRAKNILMQAAVRPGGVSVELLEQPAERELHAAVARLASVNGGYETRLRSLASLRAPVDRFFDDVLVMAEDPRLRANRLGLLSQALALFYRIADISRLGG